MSSSSATGACSKSDNFSESYALTSSPFTTHAKEKRLKAFETEFIYSGIDDVGLEKRICDLYKQVLGVLETTFKEQIIPLREQIIYCDLDSDLENRVCDLYKQVLDVVDATFREQIIGSKLDQDLKNCTSDVNRKVYNSLEANFREKLTSAEFDQSLKDCINGLLNKFK